MLIILSSEHREMLKCDVVAISDTGMVAPGVGTFTYGLRGIACCEVILRGPKTDPHSGLFGGAVANPAAAMARLASAMVASPKWKIDAARTASAGAVTWRTYRRDARGGNPIPPSPPRHIATLARC